MTLLVLGLSHRTAPIDVLERLAVPADLTAKALLSLTQREHVQEAVVLSTCNRVEVYANVTRYHGGMADVRDHLAEWGGLDPTTFAHLTYDRFDREAAEHLFAVASGLESMVVGERQIHAQVRQAFADALEEGAAGPVLNRVFRQAVRVGRRTRSETGIADGAASIVDLALATAEQYLTSEAPNVLVVGAGKIGGMAGTRIAEDAAHVAVANRTVEKADGLVERIGGSAHGLDELPALLAAADLAITSTDASQPVITVHDVRRAMQQRPDRPLVLVDLAVPRDIDTDVHAIPGVSVVDIESMRSVVAQGPTGDAVRDARAIVAQEADDFLAWSRGVQAGPTISALRQRAEVVRLAELDRLKAKLSGLDDAQRDAVDALTKGILNTLLHEPTVRLKGLVDSPDGERFVRALSHLFDLAPDGDVDRADRNG
ncbi:glutamyl-tRNA reductase [Euzebya pacifica]|uniref:glutamyl-tRNA reductase n=1 Tax=Euzebya pacifica TaxID=1608957 RepID=UPI000DF7C27B|nr:glutamyl-tRNA reductase [Euzebya pacifica]